MRWAVLQGLGGADGDRRREQRLEEGLFLTQFTQRVTVVERGETLRGSKLLQDKVRNHARMDVLTSHGVREFRAKEGGKLGSVVLENLANGESVERHPAGAFVFIGQDPNTRFLRDQVELDERGFIVTDQSFMTSVPGVFAAGDVRAGSTKQLASAVGEGAAVAIAARGYLESRSAA